MRIAFRLFCMIIMMSAALGESPFMLSSLEQLKELENILIIFTRKTALNGMCPKPIWFHTRRCKNGGKTGAATRRPVLTRSDEVQLEKKYFE